MSTPSRRLHESAKQAALAASVLEKRGDIPADLIEDIDELAGQADDLKGRVERVVAND
jgi:hypothetical protein